MAVVWHPKYGGIFECQMMRKKKKNGFLLGNAFNVYIMVILKHSAANTSYSSKIFVNIYNNS